MSDRGNIAGLFPQTDKVIAKPVPGKTKEELQGFISANVSQKAMIYTDDHKKLYRTSF